MFSKTTTLRVQAPAKINLCLEVLRRRADGYHDIRSIALPVSLYDELTFEADDKLSLTVSGDASQAHALSSRPTRENLVVRAAELLRARFDVRAGARITLHKRIPLGGGLGGGSGNAAATLRALRLFWQLPATDEELAELGATLGCDVPLMTLNRVALMEGLGERLTPLPAGADIRNGWWLALLNPGFEVHTGDIYRRCMPGGLTIDDARFTLVRFAIANGSVADAARGLFNGLQETVFTKYPLLRILAQTLDREGALGSLLSGSGASVFGLAASENDANELVKRVKTRLGMDLWSRVVRLLPDGVMAAHGPLEARV